MKKQIPEITILLILMTTGYVLNLVLGITGSMYPPNSFTQITLWQIGDSMAIMASVLAGRQIGARGQNIAAAGFTLLAIAFGISFAASTFSSVNEEKLATIILPLVPALILISFCRLFPLWLRIGSLAACIPFYFIYINVLENTYDPSNMSNAIAYTGIQILGVLWSVFIFLDHTKQQL